MLQVYLLGSPKVTWQGRSLALPRRQVRAVLYCLAVRPQRIAREKLCFLFWPNIPESLARRHLSHLLSHIRTSLPGVDLLRSTEMEVGLDPARTWSDTDAFEQLYALGSIEACQQIEALYRGNFLSGFSLPGCAEFDRWASFEGFLFENRYLSTLARLIDDAVTSEKYPEAIALAQRYLAIDDLAEPIHRRLIELYTLTGNRSAALQQFERCAVVLERELGVNPMPETRAVFKSILEDRGLVSSSRKTSPSAQLLANFDVPLVGRVEALARLDQALAQSMYGQAQVVLISGEAGIGKTRLMNAFLDQHADETIVLTSACHPAIRSIPYQPLVEALAPVVTTAATAPGIQDDAKADPEGSCLLSLSWLAEVARLLPDLHTLYPGLPAPLPTRTEEARGRLFEALYRMFLDLASKPLPLLLAIDDLHWADTTTLDWLGYFAHYVHRHEQLGRKTTRLLILGTYRKEQEQALDGFRRTLDSTINCVELELGGLDPPDVSALVENLVSPATQLDSIDRSHLTAWLTRVTGSNPFFLIETLRSLLEKGVLQANRMDLSRVPVAKSLRLAVDERVQVLSPQARQILEAGAVINDVFDFHLVHLTAGRDELETLDGLEELIARQFFIEDRGSYQFRHDLIQQVVVNGLAPMRRQLLHRRAGAAYEILQPDAVTTLAYHFTKGSQSLKAVHYHTLAAQQAERLFAWQEAEVHQETILSLLDQLDPEAKQVAYNQQRVHILAARAHLRYFQGRLADRDRDLATLDALAQAGPDELRLIVKREKVRYLNLDSHYEQAITEAQEGLDIARQLEDHPAAARMLTQIGFAHYLLGQPQAALTALETARSMADEDLDGVLRGHINHILGYVHLHLANYQRSLACQREAYAIHQSAGDVNRQAWDGMDIGLLLLKLGRFSESKQYLEDHLALARRIFAHPPEAYGLTLLGNWHLYQGDYHQAVTTFQRALDLQREVGSGQGSIAASCGLGLSLYHLGNSSQARQHLHSAAEQARLISHLRRKVEVLVNIGLLEISADNDQRSIQVLKKAVDIARSTEFYEGLVSGLAALARAHRLAGDAETALQHAREAAALAGEKALPMNALWGHLEIGLAYLAQGDLAAALVQTGQAVSLLPQAHQSWIGTEQVHWTHARILQAAERSEEAEIHQDNAETCIMRKAALIPDPQKRQRYLNFTRDLLSNHC
jgi:DNA-binding SARP family transcriptional activator/tetratricopeptide (TPR) repeat protein